MNTDVPAGVGASLLDTQLNIEKTMHNIALKVFIHPQQAFCSQYSGTPLNGHPWVVDTHDITDSSESPDCPSIHFNT